MCQACVNPAGYLVNSKTGNPGHKVKDDGLELAPYLFNHSMQYAYSLLVEKTYELGRF